MATLAQVDLTRDGALLGLPMPLTLRPPAAMTDEELIAFSRRNRPYRIEQNAEGELEIMSPVGFEGGERELFVMRKLGDWADEHGGRCSSSNAGFMLTDNSVRSPDASWVSDTRMNALNEAERRGFAPLCPDFLVEILPESDSRPRLEEKMGMWISNGARLAWMIDPFAGDLLIYRPGRAAERLVRPEWVEADAVVPGFRLETSRLWAKVVPGS
jgi:Uma2 family endonuclease